MNCAAHHNRSLSDVKWDGRGGDAGRNPRRTETGAASVAQAHKKEQYLVQAHRKQDDKNLLEKGFTLIELLVVVAILGILAAVAIFAVGNLTDTAKKNSCATEASTVETAAEAIKTQTGTYPAHDGCHGGRGQPEDGAEVRGRHRPPTSSSYNSSTGTVTPHAACSG